MRDRSGILRAEIQSGNRKCHGIAKTIRNGGWQTANNARIRENLKQTNPLETSA
ncbi:hypothetical protein J6590_084805 [Homalodisca vitripennis]|nr:hypothetical protein J6590_084805 [Homalodisca vitripennis]